MNDLISRQAAIDAILHNQEVYSNNFGDDPIDKYTVAIIDNDAQTIAQLPSAHRWIPVTERKPEEDYCTGRGRQYSAHVLVTVINHGADGETFTDMAYTLDGEWQLTHPHDNDPDVPEWCEIIAWMPCPKPWKGEEQ